MKKGLKKLIASAAIATSLAIPMATITTGASTGQEAKANEFIDQYFPGLSDWEKEFLDAYFKQMADDAYEDWYNNGHLRPPALRP